MMCPRARTQTADTVCTLSGLKLNARVAIGNAVGSHLETQSSTAARFSALRSAPTKGIFVGGDPVERKHLDGLQANVFLHSAPAHAEVVVSGLGVRLRKVANDMLAVEVKTHELPGTVREALLDGALGRVRR